MRSNLIEEVVVVPPRVGAYRSERSERGGLLMIPRSGWATLAVLGWGVCDFVLSFFFLRVAVKF